MLLCIFIIQASCLFAESPIFGLKKKPDPYVRKFYGTFSFGEGIGLSGTLYTRNHSLYTLRYLHEDRSLGTNPFWEKSPSAHLNEFGIMYGKGLDIWRFFVNGSAGFAYINYFTDITPDRRQTAGIIANIQASYALKSWMGIGLEFYGDLNPVQTRTGFLVNLHFGLVRSR
jgi:hypothetical protein